MGGGEDQGGTHHVEGEEGRGEEGRSGYQEGGGRGAGQVGVAAYLEAPPPRYLQCRCPSLVINNNNVTTPTSLSRTYLPPPHYHSYHSPHHSD